VSGLVIPAKAGIHGFLSAVGTPAIPAFAGMTTGAGITFMKVNLNP
jgi:hypothetical protein